jgi:hypothetical protein
MVEKRQINITSHQLHGISNYDKNLEEPPKNFKTCRLPSLGLDLSIFVEFFEIYFFILSLSKTVQRYLN